MIEFLLIILSYCGIGLDEAKATNPYDYPDHLDRAQTEYYLKHGEKFDIDGGITGDTMGS